MYFLPDKRPRSTLRGCVLLFLALLALSVRAQSLVLTLDAVDHPLFAASGLRLLAQPFAAFVGIALTRECESAVFEQNDTWQASNIGLPKDAVALLIILWALIILPKRERQLTGETEQQETQSELFGNVKLTPLAHEASRGIPQNVLLEDYGKLLGGKTRISFSLPQLARLGFIELKNKVIHEGPLLDLAFDYAEMAPRILNGALADLLKQRGLLRDTTEQEAH